MPEPAVSLGLHEAFGIPQNTLYFFPLVNCWAFAALPRATSQRSWAVRAQG